MLLPCLLAGLAFGFCVFGFLASVVWSESMVLCSIWLFLMVGIVSCFTDEWFCICGVLDYLKSLPRYMLCIEHNLAFFDSLRLLSLKASETINIAVAPC